MNIVPLPRGLADDPPDAALVRRLCDGDEGAFRLLYERHTPRLRMTVRRLLGPGASDVDDVVQDTWLAAYRGATHYRGDGRFSAWLIAIGARAAYATLSRRGASNTPLLDDVAEPRAEAAGAAVDLERALARLPDQQRLVVVLHDVEGFTHDEIADQLGMAVGTSKSTLSRARHALRQLLTTGASHARR